MPRGWTPAKPWRLRVHEGSPPRQHQPGNVQSSNDRGERGHHDGHEDGLPLGFEEDDGLRSAFVRRLLLRQSEHEDAIASSSDGPIPRTLVRYWHDPHDLPDDVRSCLDSWNRLRDEGFNLLTYDDASAAAYIRENYTRRETDAFGRCLHPAMRSDYFRMCFVLREGGLYVDADDVLVGGVEPLITDGVLKLQPLCYDLAEQAMAPAADVWRPNLRDGDRIFYSNNNPLAAAPGHPVLVRALARATALLLSGSPNLEIQSTTGPGNLTASLVAHAWELEMSRRTPDFRFIRDWGAIAETRWELSYRADARNWRNISAIRP